MEVNWYYTGINMQPAAHPSSTLMFAEASEAGQIVAKQLSENAVLAKELAKLLMRPATHTIFTCARGSSDHAAAYGKFLFETRLRKTVSSHPRSEEHTSELQSLMRISYAVFCLKKKKKQNTTDIQ